MPRAQIRPRLSTRSTHLRKELRTPFEKESRLSSTIFQTEDAKEGPKAFAEKRDPELAGQVVNVDPRTPCIIGVGPQTWHPDEVGPEGAPEPLDDVGGGRARGRDRQRAGPTRSTASTRSTSCTARPGSTTTPCNGSPIDSAPTRSSATTRASAARRRQQLVNATATRMLRGELDVALVVGAEALATQTALQEARRALRRTRSSRTRSGRSRGRRRSTRRGRARGLPGVADVRDLRQRAPRAPRHRSRRVPHRQLGEHVAPMSRGRGREPRGVVPDRAHRRGDHHRRPDNRMVGYPYTKYMVVDHGRRHGRGRARRDARARRRARDRPRSARVPARLVLRDRSRCYVAEHARDVALAGDGRRPRRRRSRAPASASTTSRTSISTRASAPRCTSRCDALGISPLDDRGRSPSPAGCRTTAAPGSDYLDPLDRHDGATCCAPTPARTASSAASACT